MATRTDRVQVIFEVGGDGKLKASFAGIAGEGDKASKSISRLSDQLITLSERLDKNTAKSNEAARAKAILDESLKKGLITQSQYNSMLWKSSEQYERITRAAKIAGTVLGTGLVAVMGLVIKNTMEAERVDAQLEARLKSTAGAAGMTKQALDDLATATARKTTFDDESVKSAEAMLLTFTKVHADVFPKAIAAITDMATAMGTDLESATLQLGKALNDPIQGVSALQRVGVSFTADQKEVIKSLVETGRAAEAQLLILRELETEFGGAAEAARNTFGGAITALKNSLGDLLEGEGGSLDSATGAINDLTDTMNDPDVRAGFASLTSGLAEVAGWAVRATAELVNATTALRDYYAQNDKQSTTLLQNRKTELETEQFGLARKTGVGYRWREAAVQQELDQIDAELARRRAQGIANNQPTNGGARFSAEYEARSLNFNPNPSAAKKPDSAAGGGRGSRMPDFYAATVADIQREIDEAARLDDQWKALAATLAGPLAAAQNEHEQNLRQITDLGKAAGASAADIDKAKEQEVARYNQEAEAIRARLDPTRALIQDMEFEIQLLGMGNDAREREILLRRAGASATEEQRQRVDELIQQLKGARELDDTKRDLRDLFVDVGMDIGDAENAVEQFFDTLKRRALQALADNLIGKLFPQQQPGGDTGSGGGWMSILGSVFSGLFGGGRATGGSVSGGSLYEVVERNQPEVFEQNGRRYLIPGGPGWVTPAQPIGGGSAAGSTAGGGFASVTINNYGNPNGVRTEERSGPGGLRELLVFVQETAVNAVAADMQKGGKVAKTGQMAFGWQRQGVVRGS